MAELPKGVTKEVRRGGSGVLELLLIDFDREGGDGYIRIEKNSTPNAIAQLVIIGGKPAMALFEKESLLMGHSALDELRNCAADDESRISVHTDVDFGLISDLHPEAKLYIREEDDITGQKIEGWIIDTKSDSHWWRHKQKREWTMTEDTLVEEVEEDSEFNTPQIIDYSPGEELESGCSYIIDVQVPDSVLKIAAHLGAIGHPLLVISRTPPSYLAEQFDLPISCCRWLSEREIDGVKSIHPGLETVRRECDEFLRGSTRSVIVIDGVEYLSGVHGFSRLIGMLRDLFDGVSISDDIVFIPADLDVWDERERVLLLRECDQISIERAKEWAERPAVIEGHSFCQETEGATIPEPKIINVVTEAAEDFKSAAAKLLENSGDNLQLNENQGSVSNTNKLEFQPPKTSFSAQSLLDEIKMEDEGDNVIEIVDELPITSSTEIVDDVDIQLPDWATTPSANMANDSSKIISETQMIDVEKYESETLTFTENKLELVEVVEEDDEIEKGPMKPTINHRKRVKRKLKVPVKPDILLLERGSMHYAAENSKQFEGELSVPGYEAIESSVRSLNSKKDKFREISDWETNEERDWEVIETRGMGAAVDNSRKLGHQVKTSESSSISKLNVRQWGAAASSAANVNARSSTPLLIENDNVRESASRAQKVKTLTQKLVDTELDALYSDRKQMVSSSGVELEILERITNLADKGHPVREVVERIEANSKEGVSFLASIEKKSKLVDDLIKRLNIQEERAVIEPKIATKYRNHLIQFELINEVKALLEDFEGKNSN